MLLIVSENKNFLESLSYTVKIIKMISDAVILLNKPIGMTSFEAVRNVKNLLHVKKVGHTGTLDPDASGLMIVLVGKYTKLLPYCVKDHKKYHATFCLGKRTDTEDISGAVLEERTPQIHSQEELDAACKKFVGDIEQIPPMYSAIKINGKKLYELARKGKIVERSPRPITIFSLSVKQIEENTFIMDADVSSGTYIRTLISDYAASLGELATMTSLVRTGIEHLSLEDAATLEQLAQEKGFLEPKNILSQEFELVECDDPQSVYQGKTFSLKNHSNHIIFLKNDMILAAYEKKEDGLYHCLRGLF